MLIIPFSSFERILGLSNHTPANLQTACSNNSHIQFGAWAPYNFRLEDMEGSQQVKAIEKMLAQGFDEYYLVMANFDSPSEVKSTERLLVSADNTNLKIIIILLPPSESGVGGRNASNFDWKGWMSYFNSLKERHPSFSGFAVDDFNVVTSENIIDINIRPPSFSGFAVEDFNVVSRRNNIDNMQSMISTNLTDALGSKRSDVKFYPVMYLDKGGFQTLKAVFNEFITGIILASPSFYNITNLDSSAEQISNMFQDKSLKYIIYPTRIRGNIPTDDLISTTASTASNLFSEIIVYVKVDHPVIQDFLHKLRSC